MDGLRFRTLKAQIQGNTPPTLREWVEEFLVSGSLDLGDYSLEKGQSPGPVVLEEIGLALRARTESQPTPQTPALWLRLGVSQLLLHRVHRFLEGRKSMGQPTLQHQYVQTSIASFLADHLSVAALLEEREGDLSEEESRGLHHQVTRGDQNLCRLMGGHGFLTGETTNQLGGFSRLIANLFEEAAHD